MNRLGAIQHAVKRQVGEHVSLRAVRAASLGTADHTVISGVNFIFTLVVARSLGPSAFGMFALFFMLMMLVGTFQDAFVTTPHTVISASKTGDAYPVYTSSVLALQAAFAVGSIVIFAGAAGVALVLSPGVASVLLVIAFASAATQAQSFVHRVLYTESRFGAALINNLITNGLRITLLGALLLTIGITLERLFAVFSIAFIIGTFVGLWQIRDSLTFAFDRTVVAEHWRFGHWLCGSRLISQLPQYLTAALLSSTLSVGAFGAYRAVSQLLHGANLPLRVLDSLLRPRFARDAQHGPHAVWRTMRPILVIGSAGFVLFAIAAIVLREPMLRIIYGPEYIPFAAVIFLLALKPLGTLIKELLTNALLAFRQTRSLFFRSLLSAAIGSVLGSVAIITFGLPAAGAISIFGTLASVVWLGVAWRRQLQGVSERSSKRFATLEIPVRRWLSQ